MRLSIGLLKAKIFYPLRPPPREDLPLDERLELPEERTPDEREELREDLLIPEEREELLDERLIPEERELLEERFTPDERVPLE